MSRQPAICGKHKGCLNCGVAADVLPLNAALAVGFGMVRVTRNGKRVWMGDEGLKLRPRTMRWVERLAAAAPNFDWRVEFHAPLSDRTYQRQGRRRWVLIQQGMGFA